MDSLTYLKDPHTIGSLTYCQLSIKWIFHIRTFANHHIWSHSGEYDLVYNRTTSVKLLLWQGVAICSEIIFLIIILARKSYV